MTSTCAAHVPGARFVHLDRDLSAPKTGRNGRHPLPAPADAAALFGRLGIDAGKQVVAYDQDANLYASRLWWMLRWLGHDAVAVLDGGFAQWRRENRPRDRTDSPGAAPATFTPGVTLPTASVQDVLDSLPTRSRFIVDARAPERFRGEVEPLDPVAGHIPGAHNWPYGRNLNADGTFKSPAALRGRIRRVPRPDAAATHRPPLRQRRDRVPQHPRDGCSPAIPATRALSGLVERMGAPIARAPSPPAVSFASNSRQSARRLFALPGARPVACCARGHSPEHEHGNAPLAIHSNARRGRDRHAAVRPLHPHIRSRRGHRPVGGSAGGDRRRDGRSRLRGARVPRMARRSRPALAPSGSADRLDHRAAVWRRVR